MFDESELQRLLAGDDEEIDVADWQRYTIYDSRADRDCNSENRVWIFQRFSRNDFIYWADIYLTDWFHKLYFIFV